MTEERTEAAIAIAIEEQLREDLTAPLSGLDNAAAEPRDVSVKQAEQQAVIDRANQKIEQAFKGTKLNDPTEDE